MTSPPAGSSSATFARERATPRLSFIRGQGPTLGPPKSAAAHRTVTIPQRAVDLLAEHVELFVDDDPDALVFISVKGCTFVNRYFSPYWKQALRSADLPENTRFPSR